VSLSPSTTHLFDAPEFILTQRHRQHTRGHCFFARVSHTVSTLPFWPNSGTLRLPVSRCYKFEGDIIDTGANRRSMMSKSQYRAYHYEFGVIGNITPVSRTISGIAGNSVKVIGIAAIPIPFPKLDFVVIVNFEIKSPNSPSLIALADMKRAGFDSVSFLDDLLWYNSKSYELSLHNMLWYHKWNPEDMPYALLRMRSSENYIIDLGILLYHECTQYLKERDQKK
jgi:hypothetical protein